MRQVLSWWSPSRTFDNVTPWIEETDGNQERRSLVEKLRLLTDKGWLPTADCYAGEAWDGPPVFDRFFAGIEDRGLVLPFKKWPNYARKKTTKNHWKVFLRWVGVSWEPKIRRVGLPRPEDNDWKAVWHWHQMPWEPPESKFVKYLEVSNLRNRCRYSDGSYLGADWKIEYFSEFIGETNDSDKSASIIRRMISLAKAVKQKRATYYKPYNQSDPRHPQQYDNFAAYQLLHEEWLPCKPALFHRYQRVAPQDAFLPEKGLKNLFPEVDRKGIKDEEWFQHTMFVLRNNLAVQDELPEDPEDWHKWMQKLQEIDATSEDDDYRALLQSAAATLYREYLKPDRENSKLPAGIDVPCMCWENDNEVLAFSSPDEVFYIDQPHLDEVRQEIESKEFKLFILSLKAGKDAPERLGVCRLSDKLHAEPCYEKDVQSESDRLSRRYKERRLGLNLTAKLRKSLPEELNIVAVHGLRLTLTSNSQSVTDVEVLSWKTEDGLLLINLDKDKWRALGHGLTARIAMAEDKASLFENLLREDDKDVYLDRLRQEGVTEHDIKDAESAWTISTGSTPEPESPQESGPNTESDLVAEEGLEEKPKNSFSQMERRKKDSERRKSAETIKPPQGSKSGSKPNMETGQAAEDWLEEKLKRIFKHVERRHIDEENRESDFAVLSGSRKFHIEVKHVENLPGTIYWTGNECKKAQDNSNDYFMAILSHNGDGAYKILWIWNPLEELKRASREVQWTGNSGYKSVGTDSWDITERWPNKVPTKRYDFRIKLNDEVVEGFEEDTEDLKALCRKIDNLKAEKGIES